MAGPMRIRTRHHRRAWVVLLGVAALCAWPAPAAAYIGPGAGFALVSSFFVLAATIVFAFIAVASWPFRAAWRFVARTRRARPLVRRLVILGFDGQEPSLTDAWMAEGKLPHFAALATRGCYHRLRTTFPAVSPVAWSSFGTGTNPGRHNVFDFLDRDRRTYLPRLSSIRITNPERHITLGRYRVALRPPRFELLRKSQPFWALLGRAGVWSTILRVPVSFPPDRFFGAQLSAMAAPDLLGTQGTFCLYTTRPAEARFREGGIRVALTFDGDRALTRIDGPENPFAANGAPLSIAMSVTRDNGARTVVVGLPDQRVTLAPGVLSDWIRLRFRAAPLVTVTGLCRMQLTEMGEHVSIYVSPIGLDPERPAMPISHPGYYAPYLASRIGPYSTLGLAEDTWALNEGAIDDETFLQQANDIDDERQRMCLAALDRLREGTLACVFDATDRVQHMFWRDLDPSHPAAAGRPKRAVNAIEAQYRRNDAFLGRVMAELGNDDVLIVLSDHGFTSFRRGVNLNRWLLDHGYLALAPGCDGTSEWLRDVDWSRTRAYALGLTGIFLNVRGREREGIVEPGDEAARLKRELQTALGNLRDPDTGAVAIRELFDTAAVYSGPYVENAPDLIVGYNAGYRVSWECASGTIAGPVFADNVKAWSGDHCVDPRLVPGVFFCSRPIARTEPAIVDIAPTVLRLFGLPIPRHVEGVPLFEERTA